MVSDLLNPITILWHMANAAILLVAVYFLLYKPVRKYMNRRTDDISSAIDNAKQKQAEAEEMLAKGHDTVRETNRQAADTIAQAAQQAQARAQEIIDAAHVKAGEIETKAQADAESLQSHARETVSEEAAALAVNIAQKLLSREVSEGDHDKLINAFLSGAPKEEEGAAK